MVSRCIFLFFTLFITALCGAQQQPPTFTSKAELVVVPVIVTAHGEYVRGLTAKDFSIRNNNGVEQVAMFEEIEAAHATVERAALPSKTVQNFATTNAHQDIVVILLDFLNGSWSTAARMRAYLKDVGKVLEESKTPASVLMLTPKKGLLQVHSFTTDTRGFVDAVQRWADHAGGQSWQQRMVDSWSNPFAATDVETGAGLLHQYAFGSDFADQMKLDKAEMTLQALEQVAEAYRGIPGRKKLVWMSTGFPTGLDVNQVSSGNTISTEFHIRDKAIRSWQALSDANIVVYPVDTNGVTNPGWEARFSAAHGRGVLPPPSLEVTTNTSSLLEVAARTGGKTCTDSPNVCLGKALADSPHYYVLGFYLHGNPKPGWHKLKVQVSTADANVRARAGFMVGQEALPGREVKSAKTAKESGPAKQEDVVLTALASPLDYTSVPLTLSWALKSAKPSEQGVEILVSSPPGAIGISPDTQSVSLDMLAYVREPGKEDGETFPVTLNRKLSQAEQERLSQSGFVFRKQVPLRPGRYEVRYFVRDNVNKRIGTVSTVVEVPKM